MPMPNKLLYEVDEIHGLHFHELNKKNDLLDRYAKFECLQKAYKYFNNSLFDYSLPPCLVVKGKRVGGFVMHHVDSVNEVEIDVITLSGSMLETMPVEDALHALYMQMCMMYASILYGIDIRMDGLMLILKGEVYRGQILGDDFAHISFKERLNIDNLLRGQSFYGSCQSLLTVDFILNWYKCFSKIVR